MTENLNIEFITDRSGNKKAVQIPIKEWEAIEQKLSDLDDYMDIKSNLKTAFIEVNQIKNGDLPKKTMKAFLEDC